MMTRVIINPKWRMPRANSVSGGRAASRWAISPKAVSRPVETMTAVPIPVWTAVPRKTLLLASVTPCVPFGSSPATFFYRERLAGQRGLADLKVLGVEQTGVRRHEISCREPRPRSAGPSPARRERRRRSWRPACGTPPPRDAPGTPAEQDHRDDDHATDGVAQRDRDDAGHQQNDDEGIGERVPAVETEAPLRLVRGQPRGSRPQGLQQPRERSVPEALESCLPRRPTYARHAPRLQGVRGRAIAPRA
jgi:hypothetical protein